MRAAAHPLERGAVAPPLSGPLESLDAWRARAPRNAWLVLLICAFFGARAMANLWPQWLAWRASSDSIHALSFVDEWLRVAWPCALVLLGATAFAGILRALPFLAQRRPQQPSRLWRALAILGALVLLLRGAGYVMRAWDALWRDGTSAGEIFLGLPLGLTGVGIVRPRGVSGSETRPRSRSNRCRCRGAGAANSSIWRSFAAGRVAPNYGCASIEKRACHARRMEFNERAAFGFERRVA
jgi:hypothetical protein